MPDTRSRAACNGCRSRKQKCDEEKPECSRCRQLGSRCTWSKTRKRGPAKGYAEALERRLEETEVAFLRLLLASNSQIRAQAFQHATLDIAQSYRAGFYTGAANDPSGESEHLKAAIMNQWERLPLKTSSDVERWTKAVTNASGSANDSAEIGSKTAPLRGFGDSQQRFPGQNARNIVPEGAQFSAIPITAPAQGQLLQGSYVTTENQPIGSTDAIQTTPGSINKVDLPEEFKSQFLW